VLDNAIDHTPEGADVLVEAQADGDGVVIRVENSGCRLSATDLAHVFDPFWRKDPARSDDGHSGLGLALVRAWCDAVGATVRVEMPDPARFAITVRLPGAQPLAPIPRARVVTGPAEPPAIVARH
jgi:signal transduction histidine kinase